MDSITVLSYRASLFRKKSGTEIHSAGILFPLKNQDIGKPPFTGWLFF